MQDKDTIILEKIVKYCNDIASYIENMSENDFAGDSKTVSACAFCLGQIGELSKKISDDKKNEYPHIPWHKIYGLRNRLVHDYDGVNMSQLWIIVSEDIPDVKNELLSVDNNDAD